MVKKMFYAFMALLFICAFTINTPVYAQEEEEEVVEDVADISLEDLLNVEITTAGKRAERISDIPASVVLITREDIERYGYTSLKEILENVPGVYALEDMSYYGTSFGMRGYASQAPRNIIFLVNGVHQKDAFWQTSAIRNFNIPTEAIDRIEVVRGPMSVIYGSGAFFGAINIITDQVDEGKATNIISVSGGSLNTKKAAARFSGIARDLKYAFTAGYYKTDGPDVTLDTMTTLVDDLPFYGIDDTNNTTKGRLNDENKYFNLSAEYKGLYTKMSFSESDEENYIVLPSVSDGHLTTMNHSTIAIGYRNDFSDKFTLDTSIIYHRNEWATRFDFFAPGTIGDEFARSKEFELDLTTIFSPSDKVNITTGIHYRKLYDYESYDLIPAFPYDFRQKLPDGIKIPSLFMQADLKLGKSLRLVLGGRLERIEKYTLEGYEILLDGTETLVASGLYERDDIEFIPRAAVIFSLNEQNYIKLLYGKAIRHPDFQPNLENLLFGADPVIPEYINTFEFNYIASLSPKFTLNFSVFYNVLENLIARRLAFVGGELVSVYTNAGKFETFGGELSILAKPTENFVLDLSGTYQESKNKSEGFEDIEVGLSPKLLAHLKAAYTFGGVTLGVIGRYIDKMLPIYDVATEARIGAEVEGHFLLDANLRIDNLFDQKIFINFRVNNLFDVKYLYPANINNNLWADLGTIGRGVSRSFIVTIGKRFIPVPMP